MLEGNPRNVKSTGKPAVMTDFQRDTKGLRLEKSPVNISNLEKPSDIDEFSNSRKKSTWREMYIKNVKHSVVLVFFGNMKDMSLERNLLNVNKVVKPAEIIQKELTLRKNP